MSDQDELEANLRYEAGMYQSLYENAKARIEELEAALRELIPYVDPDLDQPANQHAIADLNRKYWQARAALAPEQDK